MVEPNREPIMPIAAGNGAAMQSLRTQAKFLASCLSADKHTMKVQRRRITKALSEGFEDLVEMLAPRTILEVGAHEAGFSCKLKKRIPSARVIAFEANPDVHAKYHDEVTSGDVEYISRCISDVSETVRFSMPIHPKHGAATGMGSVLADTGYEAFKTYDVPALPLDDFLGAEADLTSAIWVDVEGAMGKVMAGAERTLANCAALYAEIETRQRWAGQATDQEIVPILLRHGLVPVLRDLQRDWQYNILCIRDLLIDQSVSRKCVEIALKMGSGATAVGL